MIFAKYLVLRYIIASNDADVLRSDESTLSTISNDDLRTKKYYESFIHLFCTFNGMFTNGFYTFNNNLFSNFLSILKVYPSENNENFSIHFMQPLKNNKGHNNLFRKVFGHFIPTDSNTTH